MERHDPEATLALAPTARDDRCANCGARLARDQRYCVECGERRGGPRLALMEGRTRAVQAIEASEPQHAPRASAGLTLIAGICTLLVAVGVGVLIGRADRAPTRQSAAAPVQVVTVAGASGASTPAAQTTTPTTTTAPSNATKPKHAKTTASAPAATKTSKAAAPPPTVTVGSQGQGRGYRNGKFTGDFFGGG